MGVLRELHDELDAAVRTAYGLSANASTSTQDTLAHLVQLNARRAAEEAQGHVRWLRPAFQYPTAPQQAPLPLQNKELPTQLDQGLEANLASNPGDPSDLPTGTAPGVLSATLPGAVIGPIATQPWPATLPEQVRAVAAVLTASPAPLSLCALEAHFKGRGAWKKGLPVILDTLAALGRARCQAALWRGV